VQRSFFGEGQLQKTTMHTIFLYALWIVFAGAAQKNNQEINAILHDESYTVRFGVNPSAGTNEVVRIQTHLAYVEQLLRNRVAHNLSAGQQAQRMYLLDQLHIYWQNAVFPTNRDYPGERRPCFIDADKNICAVGYLIEQTSGRKLAEQINAHHQYDYLLDMHEPAIESWAQEHGLTLEECAMIQPTYGNPPPAGSNTVYADVKTSYGVSSGILGGANLAMNIAMLKGNNPKVFSYIGMATGTGQLIAGLVNVRKSETSYPFFQGDPVTTSYKRQNNLSYVNIAMGTATIISSGLNLWLRSRKTDKRNAFNLYSAPTYTNSMAMGVSFTRNL